MRPSQLHCPTHQQGRFPGGCPPLCGCLQVPQGGPPSPRAGPPPQAGPPGRPPGPAPAGGSPGQTFQAASLGHRALSPASRRKWKPAPAPPTRGSVLLPGASPSSSSRRPGCFLSIETDTTRSRQPWRVALPSCREAGLPRTRTDTPAPPGPGLDGGPQAPGGDHAPNVEAQPEPRGHRLSPAPTCTGGGRRGAPAGSEPSPVNRTLHKMPSLSWAGKPPPLGPPLPGGGWGVRANGLCVLLALAPPEAGLAGGSLGSGTKVLTRLPGPRPGEVLHQGAWPRTDPPAPRQCQHQPGASPRLSRQQALPSLPGTNDHVKRAGSSRDFLAEQLMGVGGRTEEG